MDRVFQLSLTFISAQGHLEWHTALPAIQHSCCIALCELHPAKALLPSVVHLHPMHGSTCTPLLA